MICLFSKLVEIEIDSVAIFKPQPLKTIPTLRSHILLVRSLTLNIKEPNCNFLLQIRLQPVRKQPSHLSFHNMNSRFSSDCIVVYIKRSLTFIFFAFSSSVIKTTNPFFQQFMACFKSTFYLLSRQKKDKEPKLKSSSKIMCKTYCHIIHLQALVVKAHR